MQSFIATWHSQALYHRANPYVSGLLSDVERKNVESIAYRFG